MKIGVVLDDGLDKPDGVQQCILTLNKWLTEQGHEVHYIVGATKRTDLPNLHVAARNVAVKFNGNRMTIPLPTSRRSLRALLRTIQPDILHVHAPYSPFMGARAIAVSPRSTPVVGTFHIIPYGHVARIATRLLGLWLRPTLRRFHALYAGTPAAATFSEWSMRVTTGVIPHAIDVAHFRAAKQARVAGPKLTVVFLGRLVRRKGAFELVKAIAGLSPADQQRIQVRLGGRGELAEPIQAYIAAHNLADVIQLDGFIAEADKPAYLAAADIAIFPSISGESFGISLLEPMAAGAGMVVGGDNPGYHDVLAGWPEALFDPRDTVAFTSYLSNLIADEQLRNRIHVAQQAVIDQYDINRIGARWLEVYAAALAASSPTAD